MNGKYFIENQSWFNSHGEPCELREIFKAEVLDRGNYTKEEFRSWLKKYNLTLKDKCIWGCDYKTAKEYYGMGEEPVEICEETMDLKNPLIIWESDDGDNGYILIVEKYGKEAT